MNHQACEPLAPPVHKLHCVVADVFELTEDAVITDRESLALELVAEPATEAGPARWPAAEAAEAPREGFNSCCVMIVEIFGGSELSVPSFWTIMVHESLDLASWAGGVSSPLVFLL